MALLEKLKSMMGDGSEGDETYGYECGACGSEFRSTVSNPNDTVCPECGSDRVHTSL